MKRRGAAAAWLVATLACSCAGSDIVVAELPAADGGEAGVTPDAAPAACATASDCNGTELCARARCDDPAGVCTARPASCSADGAPVCGCDGVTYWNDCVRRQFGVSASTPDSCGAGGLIAVTCNATHPCPTAGALCAHLAPPGGVCPPDIPGSCWVLPASCGASDPKRWVPCGQAGACVGLCDALRAGTPHVSPPGVCH